MTLVVLRAQNVDVALGLGLRVLESSSNLAATDVTLFD
jgi:hypothetical protein